MALDDMSGAAGGGADAAAGAGAGAGAGADISGFLGGAAAAAPAAGAAAADPAAAAAEIGGGADPDWYSQVSADADGTEPGLRDWLKATGVKDLNGLAKVARDNQRALRADGRIKVPGEGATEADIAAFNKAIGVPEKAEDYALPVINGEDGQPVPMDQERLSEIAGIAHKHGIPKAALEATLNDLAQADMLRLSSSDALMQQEVDAHLKTWGARTAEKVANVTAAARELGLTREEQQAVRSALGPARALDLFADLGSRLGEDTMTMAGQRQSFGLSGAEAQKTLDTKRGDSAWVARVSVPGTAERAEYDRLQAAIGAAADRQAFELSRG